MTDNCYHVWAPGGDKAENNLDLDILPQHELHKNIGIQPDHRTGRVTHALTTAFNPMDRSCNTDGYLRGVPEQCTYLDCRDIGPGHVFGMIQLPKLSIIEGVHWELRSPAPGLVLDIGVRGCAQSIAPVSEKLDGDGNPTGERCFDPVDPQGHQPPLHGRLRRGQSAGSHRAAVF